METTRKKKNCPSNKHQESHFSVFTQRNMAWRNTVHMNLISQEKSGSQIDLWMKGTYKKQRATESTRGQTYSLSHISFVGIWSQSLEVCDRLKLSLLHRWILPAATYLCCYHLATTNVILIYDLMCSVSLPHWHSAFGEYFLSAIFSFYLNS